MKKSHILLIFSIITTIAQVAEAQTLTEEVVIDREITPVVRASVRPSWVTPTLLTPRMEKKRLSFYEFTGTSDITRSISTLEPTPWADSLMRSPYRGYASLGYFPVFNLGGAAGYRFIHNNKADVGARVSYDGSSWSGGDGTEGKFKQNQLSVGVDGTVNFGAGHLSSGVDYTYSATDGPEKGSYLRGTQAINLFDFKAEWIASHAERFNWKTGAYFGYGGFTKAKTIGNRDYEPVKDITFGANADVSYNFSEISGVALGIDADFRHIYGETLYSLYDDAKDSRLLGIIGLRPAYRFVSGKISGRVGLRLDINTGEPGNKMHLAPDVEVRWAPLQQIAVYGRATGGEVMNSNRDLWERNPWMTGVFAAERSHVNADVEIGMTFGSYKGAWATVHAGWSSVSNWAVPVSISNTSVWDMAKIEGFDFGLELGYSWKKWFTVKGNFSGATHGKYYKWQDNAKWVFDIAAKIRPVEKLQIEVGYDARLSRRGFVFDTVTADYRQVSLGHTSNLFVGAEYEVTPAFGVFLKAENLLNRHWNVVPDVRSTGVHGLLGVQYKF